MLIIFKLTSFNALNKNNFLPFPLIVALVVSELVILKGLFI